MSMSANSASNVVLRELAVLLDGLTASSVPSGVPVCGIAGDSRLVRERDLFVALKGRHFDGVDFLHDAEVRGAAAAVCGSAARDDQSIAIPVITVADLVHKVGVIADRFFAHPSAHMQVIAVTGTDGKTSVSHCIAEALSRRSGDCGLIGTLGYGRFKQLRESETTTPDAIKLHCELHQLNAQNVKHVVMEASSHGLDQGRLGGVDVDIAVFTNLGRDHLDYHVSHRNYAVAKEKLFAAGACRHAVINIADPFGRRLAQRCRRHCEVTTYSADAGVAADVTACNIECDVQGLSFILCVGSGRFAVHSRLLGRFNVGNLLAVWGVLSELGVAPEEAAQLIASLGPVRGRMQRVSVGARSAVIDYAHTPDALEHALSACREMLWHGGGRLLCLFGCGGERDRGKRALMGEVAARLADVVVISDDNPRGEDAARIIRDIQRGFPESAEVEVIHDRRRAIRHVLSLADAADCVLITGKGHESFQLIDDRRLPFDDAAVVHSLLEELAP